MTNEKFTEITNRIKKDLEEFEQQEKAKGLDTVYDDAYKINFSFCIEEYFDMLQDWELEDIDEQLVAILDWKDNVVKVLWHYFRVVANTTYNYEDMEDFGIMLFNAINYNNEN